MSKQTQKDLIEAVLERNLGGQLDKASDNFAIAMQSYRTNGTFRLANVSESLSRVISACTAAMGMAATLAALSKVESGTSKRKTMSVGEVEALADLFTRAGRPEGGAS